MATKNIRNDIVSTGYNATSGLSYNPPTAEDYKNSISSRIANGNYDGGGVTGLQSTYAAVQNTAKKQTAANKAQNKTVAQTSASKNTTTLPTTTTAATTGYRTPTTDQAKQEVNNRVSQLNANAYNPPTAEDFKKEQADRIAWLNSNAYNPPTAEEYMKNTADRLTQLGVTYNGSQTASADANANAEEAKKKATMYSPTTLIAKSSLAESPAATSSSSTNSSTTTTTTAQPTNTGYTPTGLYDPANLQAYNDQRVADIRSLYDAALQNNLASMRTAYDQNISDAETARDLISPQYQRSMNALSAEYERQRRNNNMQAAASGLNSGAGSQMALAQSANYQANQAGLAAKENQALDEANRRLANLKTNYQNAIAEATAQNNYKLAASLLDEYQNAYNRQMQIENTNYTRAWNEDERAYSRGIDEASRMAQYGDFSGYRGLYGEDIGNLMELTWAMQNPDVAWASGKLSAEDYMALTGRQPVDPTATEATGALGAGADIPGYGISSGSYGAGGYSSGGRSRGRSGGASGYGKGYNGPPGYYNEAGQFIVPDGNGGVAASYGSAQGADRYNTNPNVNGNVSAQGAKDYAEAYASAYGSGGGSYSSGGSSDTGSSESGNSWTRSDSGSGSSGNVVANWIKNLIG